GDRPEPAGHVPQRQAPPRSWAQRRRRTRDRADLHHANRGVTSPAGRRKMTKSMWLALYVAGSAWIRSAVPWTGPSAAPADRGDEARAAVATQEPAAARQPDLVAPCLTRARLPGADLRGANLIAASLGQAKLVNAHLEHADLSGANLCQAHLRGADLRGANLVGACLAGADLSGANLTGALYDDRTQWPSPGSTRFDPARRGAKRVE